MSSTLICGSQVTAEQLTGAGVITLSDSCIIKDTVFKIYTHKTQGNNFNAEANIFTVEILTISNIMNISMSAYNYTTENDSGPSTLTFCD